ncbi:hypothetical protein K438DRAFT_1989758 [Mycena galopus ATCC 62051]|nr:hypothetical protein K438DRAFT_1989758 [Mycena galopus ATCC 62051]
MAPGHHSRTVYTGPPRIGATIVDDQRIEDPQHLRALYKVLIIPKHHRYPDHFGAWPIAPARRCVRGDLRITWDPVTPQFMVAVGTVAQFSEVPVFDFERELMFFTPPPFGAPPPLKNITTAYDISPYIPNYWAPSAFNFTPDTFAQMVPVQEQNMPMFLGWGPTTLDELLCSNIPSSAIPIDGLGADSIGLGFDGSGDSQHQLPPLPAPSPPSEPASSAHIAPPTTAKRVLTKPTVFFRPASEPSPQNYRNQQTAPRTKSGPKLLK